MRRIESLAVWLFDSRPGAAVCFALSLALAVLSGWQFTGREPALWAPLLWAAAAVLSAMAAGCHLAKALPE
jgi:hypothetical protein